MKTKIFLTLFSGCALILTNGCASTKKITLPPAEGYFQDLEIEQVKSRIMEGCTFNGYTIEESSDNQITCSKTTEGGTAIMTQLLLGNSYSTTPELKARFTVYKQKDYIKVTTHQWAETQMAYGQVRRQALNDGKNRENLQNFLYSIGAK